MGHTSPILGKERETKILFQTLVSELKKKRVLGKTDNKNTNNSPRPCDLPGKQGVLPPWYQIREEESLTVLD